MSGLNNEVALQPCRLALPAPEFQMADMVDVLRAMPWMEDALQLGVQRLVLQPGVGLAPVQRWTLLAPLLGKEPLDLVHHMEALAT